jgi:uncharacterized protein (DUF1501 family)
MHCTMPRSERTDPARRAFLQRVSSLAAVGAVSPLAINLAALGEAAAFQATDYKALVCVFLVGGNDSANTVVPYDTATYDQYHRIRGGGPGRTAGGIALARADLEATVLTPAAARTDSLQFALHPQMSRLARLFSERKASVVFNVGPLVEPTTLAQYRQQSVRLPPKLFSHNDQQAYWAAESPEGAQSGWGGRIGDLALSSNQKAQFTCISTDGNAIFLAGRNAAQYQISPGGAVALLAYKFGTFFSVRVRDEIRSLLQQSRGDPFEADYVAVIDRSIDYEKQIEQALADSDVRTNFPGNSLGAQLRMVARLIRARAGLGASRQVFFVQLGGFDLHSNMMSRQPGQLREVSESMGAFHDAMVEIGTSDKVTAFTASDFGRTLSFNGDGSDHGWGGHHIVVGGAVEGGRFFGTPPPFSTRESAAPEDQWHVGQGRWLPSTSLAQFGATLARWFGVSDTEALALLPNLANFGGAAYPRDLGFLRRTA